MTCYYPIPAYKDVAGSVLFYPKGSEGKSKYFKPSDLVKEFELPCGRCIGCRIRRSRDWMIRCVHEAQLHEFNCFVTLTYDAEHLPSDCSLNYRHFQLFMRKLRRRGHKSRFFMCGEYGEENSRPHFHVLLFGFRPPDLYRWRLSPSGETLFRSPLLESVWGRGSVEVGNVTSMSAGYVSGYIMDKRDRDSSRYLRFDKYTGECHYVEPEFCHMSLKPGIASRWYDKFWRDVFPHDRVIIEGKDLPVPMYYWHRYLESPDVRSDIVEYARARAARARAWDNSDERLAVKETVVKARMKFHLNRGL